MLWNMTRLRGIPASAYNIQNTLPAGVCGVLCPYSSYHIVTLCLVCHEYVRNHLLVSNVIYMHVTLLCIAMVGLSNNSVACAPSFSLYMHVYVMR
jgi:hypothetical protein